MSGVLVIFHKNFSANIRKTVAIKNRKKLLIFEGRKQQSGKIMKVTNPFSKQKILWLFFQ